MGRVHLLIFFICATVLGCGGPAFHVPEQPGKQKCGSAGGTSQESPSASPSSLASMNGALLATRFSSLDEFKSVIDIEYFTEGEGSGPEEGFASLVKLTHCSKGLAVTSILESGLSQDDIVKVKKGGFWDRLGLIFAVPYAIANRDDLQRVYILARRVPLLFGEGDPAFFDLAETSVKNINTPDLAFRLERDTTEKGYLNTFNHITAQAFISSIFSEELADFIADLHERKNMPELTSGKFTEAQLSNPTDNPVDNYVDMINNEWGQELGKELRVKYHITRETRWTPELLADYLNDIQSYYSWAFRIGFKPYRPADELVVMFANKINVVMAHRYAY